MIKAICVAGARPNFMKVKPVVDALEERGVGLLLVHTGQHYDPALSDVFFEDLGLRRPDRFLGVGSGSQAIQTAKIMVEFEHVVDQWRPDVVIVAGDVNSTVACALVGAKSGARVAHIEAGLRSRDWAMPEEINRVLTDRMSDVLLAPSADAVDVLASEGYRPDQVHLVGNTMVDSLLANRSRAGSRPIRHELGLAPGGYGLITLHRPSNVDDPAVLARIVGALEEIGRDCPLVFPVHPRTEPALAALAPLVHISAIPPLGYLDFLCLEEQAALVLTDSGGIQEETTALGVPCLTLRESTERPITVTEGTNQVVGTDPGAIVAAAEAVLAGGTPHRCPELWDGKAGERIADVLADPETYRRPRPTAMAAGELANG